MAILRIENDKGWDEGTGIMERKVARDSARQESDREYLRLLDQQLAHQEAVARQQIPDINRQTQAMDEINQRRQDLGALGYTPKLYTPDIEGRMRPGNVTSPKGNQQIFLQHFFNQMLDKDRMLKPEYTSQGLDFNRQLGIFTATNPNPGGNRTNYVQQNAPWLEPYTPPEENAEDNLYNWYKKPKKTS